MKLQGDERIDPECNIDTVERMWDSWIPGGVLSAPSNLSSSEPRPLPTYSRGFLSLPLSLSTTPLAATGEETMTDTASSSYAGQS